MAEEGIAFARRQLAIAASLSGATSVAQRDKIVLSKWAKAEITRICINQDVTDNAYGNVIEPHLKYWSSYGAFRALKRMLRIGDHPFLPQPGK